MPGETMRGRRRRWRFDYADARYGAAGHDGHGGYGGHGSRDRVARRERGHVLAERGDEVSELGDQAPPPGAERDGDKDEGREPVRGPQHGPDGLPAVFLLDGKADVDGGPIPGRHGVDAARQFGGDL